MRTHFGYALTAGALLAWGNSASADIIIDDFSDTYDRVTDPVLGPNISTSEGALLPGEGVGRTRHLQVQRTSGVDSGMVAVTIDTNSNQGQYGASAMAIGAFTIGYDGTADGAFTPDETTGLNLDFSTAHGLALSAVADFDVELLLTLFNGSAPFTASMHIPAAGAGGSLQEYFLPFDLFTGLGALDLANIDALSIASVAGADQALDVSFSQLRVTTLPEPASLGLLALGGVGAGGILRRRRRHRENYL